MDLFYRLNVVQICLPPLRARKDDIPLLFQHFVEQFCESHNKQVPEIPRDFYKKLLNRAWEGNVRELKNEAGKYALGMEDDFMDSSAIDNDLISTMELQGSSLHERVFEFEKKLIENELIRHKGNIKKTLSALKVPRQTLRDKMLKFGLQRKSYI